MARRGSGAVARNRPSWPTLGRATRLPVSVKWIATRRPASARSAAPSRRTRRPRRTTSISTSRRVCAAQRLRGDALAAADAVAADGRLAADEVEQRSGRRSRAGSSARAGSACRRGGSAPAGVTRTFASASGISMFGSASSTGWIAARNAARSTPGGASTRRVERRGVDRARVDRDRARRPRDRSRGRGRARSGSPPRSVPVSDGLPPRALARDARADRAQAEQVALRRGDRADRRVEVDRAEAGHARPAATLGIGSPGRPGSSGTRRSARPDSALTRCAAGALASPSARVRANSRLPVAPPGRPGGQRAAGGLRQARRAVLVGGHGLDRGRGADRAAHDAGLAGPRRGGRAGGREQREQGERRGGSAAVSRLIRPPLVSRGGRRHAAQPRRSVTRLATRRRAPVASRPANSIRTRTRRRVPRRLRRTFTTTVRARRAGTDAVREPSSSERLPGAQPAQRQPAAAALGLAAAHAHAHAAAAGAQARRQRDERRGARPGRAAGRRARRPRPGAAGPGATS